MAGAIPACFAAGLAVVGAVALCLGGGLVGGGARVRSVALDGEVGAPKRAAARDFPAEGGVGTPGAKVHFTVMHVVPPHKPAPAQSAPQAAEQPKADKPEAGANTIFELMRHAASMLRNDDSQLSQEKKRFAESKPKGLYKSIEAAKKRSAKYDKEAVDRSVDSGFKAEEAQREESRSDLETRRGDVAKALAHEFEAKIAQHKKELEADRFRAAEEKTEASAREIREQAAQDKDEALRDARLAGQLDDKADRTSIEARRVKEKEDQSLLQLRQLNHEVKRAEDEAKRARRDAHALRHSAAEDVRVATASLASAAKLIKCARRARQKARVKQSELSQARLALKAAARVERGLTVKAASYSGKAKLDILQSKLLTQAASTHKSASDKIKHQEEQMSEALEHLRHKEENAQIHQHEAEVRVRQAQDRLDLEKRRAKRRIARAHASADLAQNRYEQAKEKLRDTGSLDD